MYVLDRPRLKLNRAEEHLGILKVEIEKFLKAKPYSFVMQPDPRPPEYDLCGKINQTPPIGWSCIIGDFANNARSALDFLVFQLSNLQPTDDRRHRLYFPIFDSNAEYTQAEKRYLAGVKPEYKSVIERYQPYRRFDGPSEDPFGLLRRINDGDKHRDIHIVGAVANLDAFVIDDSSGAPDWLRFEHGARIRVKDKFDLGAGFAGRKIGNGAVNQDGEIVAKLVIPQPDKMKTDVEVILLFSESDPGIQGRPVLDTLVSILARAKELIREIELVLPK